MFFRLQREVRSHDSAAHGSPRIILFSCLFVLTSILAGAELFAEGKASRSAELEKNLRERVQLFWTYWSKGEKDKAVPLVYKQDRNAFIRSDNPVGFGSFQTEAIEFSGDQRVADVRVTVQKVIVGVPTTFPVTLAQKWIREGSKWFVRFGSNQATESYRTAFDEKLFQAQVEEQQRKQPPVGGEKISSGPRVIVEEAEIDFGSVKRSATSSRRITFLNQTDQEIVGANVKSACQCFTLGNTSPLHVFPGDQGFLDLVFVGLLPPGTHQGEARLHFSVAGVEPVTIKWKAVILE